MKEGTNRKDITIGAAVQVVQKNHQKTGELTAGIVSRLLTNSANHPHGIKVQLASGIVGRVQKITAN
ncbi:YwbE family protein [Tenacibaculum finnmarkense]|uniref:YwbE family protein n=1 Tax=Tenacibaculum finnmarkense TaxID=2781243 RepID=UPI00187B912B|nr:YwbE family protein [Tenacibaculum finnmarkense]MBE7648382.1 YwbE family protein [Tenacibaculum finnmarkense genomovar ulcerans]MBE7660689.1 YwbE family protein [Tenacibaculum finnmarkense genomovar finnmarkense]MCD8400817.1 YwbE family protein [Tenacibaculum finnmarkense genomovar ulcerans]MCD8410452.1 YwbE family protein [Tenacibaculum finnmarkense genomovar ulcerans]MCD8423255.1 YwbE family protein [Tenacibaculum finnmarkense genomovar ulcerans]